MISYSDYADRMVRLNRYDDYGNPQGGVVNGGFGFTGQMWLPEIGMYYYRARIFNAALGRFMQADPIGYEGGMNLYAYVGNDPLNFTDPLGLDPKKGDFPPPKCIGDKCVNPGGGGPTDNSSSCHMCSWFGSVDVRDIKSHYDASKQFHSKSVGNWYTVGNVTAMMMSTGMVGYAVDLHRQEGLGGHTIAFHVGKSHQFLINRLLQQRFHSIFGDVGLARFGSFTSLQAATRLINATLSRNSAIVAQVASGERSAAIIEARFGSPTGYEAFAPNAHRQPIIQTTYGVRVLIQHAPSAPGGFLVYTGFPVR